MGCCCKNSNKLSVSISLELGAKDFYNSLQPYNYEQYKFTYTGEDELANSQTIVNYKVNKQTTGNYRGQCKDGKPYGKGKLITKKKIYEGY